MFVDSIWCRRQTMRHPHSRSSVLRQARMSSRGTTRAYPYARFATARSTWRYSPSSRSTYAAYAALRPFCVGAAREGPQIKAFFFGPFSHPTSPESRIRVRSPLYFALSSSVETVGIEPTSMIA
jgi:hypothetical protein